jgi:hypothetical protein
VRFDGLADRADVVALAVRVKSPDTSFGISLGRSRREPARRH